MTETNMSVIARVSQEKGVAQASAAKLAGMEGTITRVSNEAEGTKGFRIRLPKTLSIRPGQYVMLAFPDEPQTKRAFSVVEYNEKRGELFLVIQHSRYFTTKLFTAEPGDPILVYGPYGRFTLPQKHRPIVFIAGGIGITPLYSMLVSAIKERFEEPLHLFYTAKNKRAMAFLKKMDRLASSGVHVHLSLTQEEIDGFAHGRVHVSTLKRLVPELFESLIYLCGPKFMIQDLTHQLLESGIAAENIRSEEFKHYD